jgi:hypothetical protein
MKRVPTTSIAYATLVLVVAACSHGADSRQDTTPAAQAAAVSPGTDASVMLRGSVVSASATELVLQSDSGQVTVAITQPFHLYTRESSDLSRVKDSTFIGVTTVKQADGSERATEIHVFPNELRGVGEGSRMMTPPAASVTRSRMTNGAATESRMTNGSTAASRMSNGSVSRATGTTLVVSYAGGAQTVTVPAATPVTELKLSSKAPAVGDKLAVMATRGPNGSLTASKAISTAK